MDEPKHDQPTIDTLTRLIVFLAESLIETNARVMATKVMLKANLLCVAEVDSNEFDRRMAEAVVAHKPSAELNLLDQLKADPDLAWLSAHIRSDTVQ